VKEDFAKIVRASNGQQILVYHEPDNESDDETDAYAVVHCIASMDFGNVDLKAYVISQEGVERYMEAFDQTAADEFIRGVEKMIGGSSNEVEKSEET
jgi:hypothetical protein